jgi:bacillithiol system protein YtxJ
MQAITSQKALKEFLSAHTATKALILKHSNTCPISARAYSVVQAHYEQNPSVPIGVVVVQTSRPLSNYIAGQYGIQHESPQAIVFAQGKPVWDDSHFAITAETLEEQLGA